MRLAILDRFFLTPTLVTNFHVDSTISLAPAHAALSLSSLLASPPVFVLSLASAVSIGFI